MGTPQVAQERAAAQAAVQASVRKMAAADSSSLESLTQVSRELDTSYRDLDAQIQRLRTELAVSRNARLQELAEKERLLGRLSSLLAVLPGGVVLLDASTTIRDANPAALDMLGEPLMGETWPDVTLRNPELTGQGDGTRHLSVNSRPLAGQGENVVLITDTTANHELEQQLGRKQRLAALGEMAARMAHQIRTPLASATLYLAQLGHDELPVAQRQRIVGRLSDRLKDMEGLIESMLSFIRGRSPVMAAISLREVLETLDSTIRPSLRAGVNLSITPVDDTLQLCGAADELVGALANLVKNAAELDQPEINIQVWAGATSANSLQIRVLDNGPGFSDEVLPRLFDPFFTTRAGGTGLGLAVVAMTAANHGGEARARSHPGGAEFLLDLPLLSASDMAGPCEATPSCMHRSTL